MKAIISIDYTKYYYEQTLRYFHYRLTNTNRFSGSIDEIEKEVNKHRKEKDFVFQAGKCYEHMYHSMREIYEWDNCVKGLEAFKEFILGEN